MLKENTLNEDKPTYTLLPDLIFDPPCDGGERLAKEVEESLKVKLGARVFQGLKETEKIC